MKDPIAEKLRKLIKLHDERYHIFIGENNFIESEVYSNLNDGIKINVLILNIDDNRKEISNSEYVTVIDTPKELIENVINNWLDEKITKIVTQLKG